MTRTFNDNWAVRAVGSPATWAAAAMYTDWVAIAGFRRCVFLPQNGELDGDMVIAVYEATDASGTSAQAISGLTDSFVNGTDEDRVGIIEVRDVDMSDGYTHLALLVTPAATDSFACVAVLGESYEAPVSNATTDGVAWIVGE